LGFWHLRKELRERTAVVLHVAADGRVLDHIPLGCGFKKAIADKHLDHRISGAQRAQKIAGYGVAIDLKARRAADLVVDNPEGEHIHWPALGELSESLLQFTQ